MLLHSCMKNHICKSLQ